MANPLLGGIFLHIASNVSPWPDPLNACKWYTPIIVTTKTRRQCVMDTLPKAGAALMESTVMAEPCPLLPPHLQQHHPLSQAIMEKGRGEGLVPQA